MEDLDRRLLLGAAGLAGVAAFAGRAKAGPLAPPAGPVASTGKQLTELEPRTAINATNTPGDSTSLYIISQSGSYYLTGNINAASGKHAIKITAHDVTIDLCGFTMKGIVGALDGVNAASGTRNTVITNGTIADFGGGGINNNGSVSSRFTDLNLTTNAAGGLATGTDATVERVNVRGGTVGIAVGDRSRVVNCEARDIITNGSGILAGQNCVIQGCVALICAGPCIDAANGSIVRDCNGSGSTASHGIRVNYGASVIGCVANANSLNGIEAIQRNLVFNCEAVANTQHGIHANFSGLVQGCFCESNGQCGIFSDGGGAVTIRGNTCGENGNSAAANGAGIRVTGAAGNLIEGNHVSANFKGVDAISTRNAIYGNRAIVNATDYVFGVGNSCGPVVNVAGAPDVSTVANANHPLANLRF
ncbi:MAG: right-handed parallel beta-helix repeat-containing protein [Phycisphaerales bacterium]